MGMKTSLKMGYTSNLENDNNFTYLIPAISFDHKLNSNGKLVLATKLKSHLNFGDSYEFYQAATIGGNDGLRAYRNQRFTGKNSFYQSTDIRFLLSKVKTSVVPLSIGLFGGFDYGKVWGEKSLTTIPGPIKNWNTSYGGGVFFNAANMLGTNVAAFNGDDGLRIVFSLGFKF
jgi:hemolysin activation/secretion protein